MSDIQKNVTLAEVKSANCSRLFSTRLSYCLSDLHNYMSDLPGTIRHLQYHPAVPVN